MSKIVESDKNESIDDKNSKYEAKIMEEYKALSVEDLFKYANSEEEYSCD